MDVLLMARRCAKALRTTVGVLAVLAFVASPAAANAGKVLVFTGTAGTPNASSAAAADRDPGARRRPTTSPPTSRAARRRSTAANLANYRAVVFVNSSGNVLDAAQEAALQDYVQGGGGFVGIGETALFEQDGKPFFNTLLGLSGERITGTGTTSAQDVEFLDRVHPATRAQPLVAAQDRDLVHVGRQPDGHGPHRRARAREHAARRHVDHERRGPALHRRHEREPAAAEPPGRVVP